MPDRHGSTPALRKGCLRFQEGESQRNLGGESSYLLRNSRGATISGGVLRAIVFSDPESGLVLVRFESREKRA